MRTGGGTAAWWRAPNRGETRRDDAGGHRGRNAVINGGLSNDAQWRDDNTADDAGRERRATLGGNGGGYGCVARSRHVSVVRVPDSFE